MTDDPNAPRTEVLPAGAQAGEYMPPETRAMIGKLLPFLRAVSYAARKCREVELRQLVHGAANRPLLSWSLAELELEQLAREILQYAQSDADAFGTPNTYVVVAYFELERVPGATSPAFRLRSSVSGVSLDGQIHGPDDVLETEPATRAGHQAQMMRHNEALMRNTIGGFSQVLAASNQVISSLQIELRRRADKEEAVEKRQMELMTLFESITTEHHKRALEERRQATNEKYRSMAFEELSLVLPVIANRFLQSKGMPGVFRERMTPEIEMIDRFFASLTPQQIERMMVVGGLTPAQQIAIGEAYQAFQQRNERMKKANGEAEKNDGGDGGTGPNGTDGSGSSGSAPSTN